jgi:hypothetical protein
MDPLIWQRAYRQINGKGMSPKDITNRKPITLTSNVASGHKLLMAINNPQTWSRLTSSKLRQLANLVGNEALKSMPRLPSPNEARAVKALTEAITRRLHGAHYNSDITTAIDSLVLSIDDFDLILSNSHFKSVLGSNIIRDGIDKKGRRLGEMVSSANDEARAYIAEYFEKLPPPLTPGEKAVNEVVELTPDQKTGPLRFTMIDGIVHVEHQAAVARTQDHQNVNAAKTELIAAGKAAKEFLSSANFDIRLVDEVSLIVKRLEADQDIIALGVSAISFQQIAEVFTNELPDFWSAKLQGFSLGLSMYVAQFPEWMRFAENAADAEFSVDDIERLYVAGRQLTEELKKQEHLVDPEVPRSLAFLLESIHQPRRAAKRTVYATVRSVENLVSVVFKAFGKIVSGIPEGGKKAVTSATAVIVGTGLLYAAATTAVYIDPAAGRVLRTTWMGKAGKLILEHLPKINEDP